MSVRQRDQQEHESEVIKRNLERDLNDLRDSEWLERLSFNQDWLKLKHLYEEQLKQLKSKSAEYKDELFKPHEPEFAMKLRDQIMVLEQAVKDTESFIGFPQREIERLNGIRGKIPVDEMRLKELNGGRIQ